MSRFDLASVDLALLEVLQTLLATRSVTETARRSGSTQPAISRSLARLREIFDDPLLVRVGRRLEPTTLARELAPRVDEAVSALRALRMPSHRFDPASERGTLTLAASDHAIAAYLGPLFRALRQEAPGAALRVRPVSSATVGELSRGELHLALGPRAPIEGMEALVIKPFARDRFVCAMRRDHPASRQRLTARRYLALDHVAVVTDRPVPSAVQVALRELGHERRVALALPSFLAVLATVARSDVVAVLPERLVAATPGVVARELPFALEPLALHAAWHPRFTTDVRHRWFRELVLRAGETPRPAARTRARAPSAR